MKSSYFWLGISVLFLTVSNLLSSWFQPRSLPPFEKPPLESFAVQDLSNVLLGSRRTGADLAFIQFLQYVSSDPEGELKRDEHGLGQIHRHGHSKEKSEASLIKEYTLRMVYLDPYFHYAYLVGSGMLAYYLNSYDDAIEILKLGMERDPTYWRFRLYAGAITYKWSAQPEKVIQLLEEAIHSPDCPTMLQNILANIHTKQGSYKRAIEIYEYIIATSRDHYYIEKSEKKMAELKKQFGLE